RDDTARRSARDLAQGVLDGFSVQIDHHTLKEEEGRCAGIEARVYAPGEPVLLLEVGTDERDPGRVDARLGQHRALDRLGLRGVDFKAADLRFPGQSERASVEPR